VVAAKQTSLTPKQKPGLALRLAGLGYFSKPPALGGQTRFARAKIQRFFTRSNTASPYRPAFTVPCERRTPPNGPNSNRRGNKAPGGRRMRLSGRAQTPLAVVRSWRIPALTWSPDNTTKPCNLCKCWILSRAHLWTRKSAKSQRLNGIKRALAND